jgi:hypothetical protein
MNPWKKLAGAATWMMRLALVFVIYTRFFGIFMQFNLDQLNFYFAAGFIVLGFLLLAGGFFKQSITVFAGLGIFILAVVQIIMNYNGLSPAFAQWLLMGSVGLFFLTNGNK